MAEGQRIDYIKADLEDAKAPARLVAETLAQAGRFDILVNNAEVASTATPRPFPRSSFVG